MNATESDKAASEAALVELAWRRGLLRFKLHQHQRDIYNALSDCTSSQFIVEAARRLGKTHLLVTLALEQCLRHPNSRVVYGAPTLKHLHEFVLPAFELLLLDCPPDIRPRWNGQRSHWEFANGSHVHLFGAENKQQAARGRGAAADLALFDEAGFTPVLGYVLGDVFRYQLRDSRRTGVKMVLSSTPSDVPEHDFTKMAERAESDGRYVRMTAFDNRRWTAAQLAGFLEEDAKEEGLTPEEYKQTDSYRREWLAERIIDMRLVVVPEWEEARKTALVAVPRPEFFRAQVSLDFGGSDPHFAGLGYYDFTRDALVVEDEVFLHAGENTLQLSEAVKAKERALWGTDSWDGTIRALPDAEELRLLENLPDFLRGRVQNDDTEWTAQQPFSRIADNNLQLVRDLLELHGLAFIPTRKDNKELQVNALRVRIRKGGLLVHPRCKHLDRHLLSTTWLNHKRKDYARRNKEHGDGVDLLVYWNRNLDKANPVPLWRRHVEPQTPGQLFRQRQAELEAGKALMGDGPLAEKLLRRVK